MAHSSKWILFSVALLVGWQAFASAAAVSQENDDSPLLQDQLFNCLEDGDDDCVTKRLVRGVDFLLHKQNLKLAESISLDVVPGYEGAVTGRSLSDADIESNLATDSKTRSDQLQTLLFDRIDKVLSSRKLNIDIGSGATIAVAKSKENGNAIDISLNMPEGRGLEEGRKKGLKKILPFLLLFKYKFVMLAALGLAAVFALAGKALLVSKLALLLSAIIGLKKLFSQKAVTYEIVSQPYYSHHTQHDSYGGGAGGHSGYGRSFDGQQAPENWNPQNVAYRSYNQQ